MNNPDADRASHRANYEVFRECISSAVVEKSEQSKNTALKSIRRRAQKARRSVKRDGLAVDNSSIAAPVDRADPEELAEFVDVRVMPPDEYQRGLFTCLGASKRVLVEERKRDI